MDLQLRDKVVLVTGGARGLGQAISEAFAAEGAHVAINYCHSGAQAKQLAADIGRQYGVRALPVPGNVAHESEVLEMFRRLQDTFSQVDILVNNAAVCPTQQVVETSESEWSETLRVNLTGAFLASRAMVQQLVARRATGRIVNVSSAAAFLGSTTGHAAYDASKGGMISFTISLAREVAPHGIAVNAVAPGMMFTDMTAGTLTANPDKYLARIPLRRIGTPQEVAHVVLFLASDCASYMTGATVDVSGGLLMR
jgi:3-oxoacyl-[acyl-carrier protein] reductase